MGTVMRLGTYPYTYLRTVVMKKKLLSKEDYDKILKMSPDEISKFIEELEYKEDITSLGVEYSGAELVERALQKNLGKDFAKVLRISPKELRELIILYQKRYDIHNIKTILRGKFSGLSNEELTAHVSPIAVQSKDYFDRLISQGTIEDVALNVSFLPENEARKAVEEFKKTNTLTHLENLLDRIYFGDVISKVNHLQQQGKLYKKFLMLEIDVMNIKLLLKMKNENVDDKVVKDLIFTYGTIKKSKIEHMLKAEKDAILKELEHTHLKDAVKGAEEKDSLSDLELKFDCFLLGEAKKLIKQSPLSVDTIIGYMFLKDIEVKNLSRIVKAKQLGLSEDFIERAVVV